jgi:hypothetical protein
VNSALRDMGMRSDNSSGRGDNAPMHASSDIRVVRCLDGLQYSFVILEHVYSGLHDTCSRIRSDHSALVPALWRCWSFVDVVHRIREITQALPGLSRKNAKLRAFLGATKDAEGFRHYIQHLRSELSKSPLNPSPVWGSLAWVDSANPASSHMVFTGAQIKDTKFTSCVFDRVECKWVSKVCLGVAGKSFNFDPIYEACLEFRDFVVPWAASTYKPGIRATGKPPIITISVVTLGKKEP